jgi:hypothetical protein
LLPGGSPARGSSKLRENQSALVGNRTQSSTFAGSRALVRRTPRTKSISVVVVAAADDHGHREWRRFGSHPYKQFGPASWFAAERPESLPPAKWQPGARPRGRALTVAGTKRSRGDQSRPGAESASERQTNSFDFSTILASIRATPRAPRPLPPPRRFPGAGGSNRNDTEFRIANTQTLAQFHVDPSVASSFECLIVRTRPPTCR